ncbi:MAG TPA: c-type cytochrome [Deltaproteobacteria bacterium]|nr:c-type cytochrome [Deltaproteobacteria bacterium]
MKSFSHQKFVLLASGFLGAFMLLSCSMLSVNARAGNDLVSRGRKVFLENCQACHQKDAEGQPGVAPSLTNKEFLSIASDRFLTETIRNGRPGTAMVGFGDTVDIKAIIAYLRSYAQLPYRGDIIDDPSKAQGDAEIGEVIFRRVCENCHGVNGAGYETGGSGPAIGKKGFLDVATDSFIRATVKEGRSNTKMRGFSGPEGLANLTDQEINDVITYMRTL